MVVRRGVAQIVLQIVSGEQKFMTLEAVVQDVVLDMGCHLGGEIADNAAVGIVAVGRHQRCLLDLIAVGFGSRVRHQDDVEILVVVEGAEIAPERVVGDDPDRAFRIVLGQADQAVVQPLIGGLVDRGGGRRNIGDDGRQHRADGAASEEADAGSEPRDDQHLQEFADKEAQPVAFVVGLASARVEETARIVLEGHDFPSLRLLSQ